MSELQFAAAESVWLPTSWIVPGLLLVSPTG
jgi:hypothetical protein